MRVNGLSCLEAYSAMYTTDPYRFPTAGRGISESYMKYQMYTNPPGYNAHMSQYGYDNGSNSMASLTCEYWVSYLKYFVSVADPGLVNGVGQGRAP